MNRQLLKFIDIKRVGQKGCRKTANDGDCGRSKRMRRLHKMTSAFTFVALIVWLLIAPVVLVLCFPLIVCSAYFCFIAEDRDLYQ